MNAQRCTVCGKEKESNPRLEPSVEMEKNSLLDLDVHVLNSRTKAEGKQGSTYTRRAPDFT